MALIDCDSHHYKDAVNPDAVRWDPEDDKEVRIMLKGYKPGDTVIEYGVDIGKVVAAIARGNPWAMIQHPVLSPEIGGVGRGCHDFCGRRGRVAPTHSDVARSTVGAGNRLTSRTIRGGLQSRARRFDSAPRLQCLILIASRAIAPGPGGETGRRKGLKIPDRKVCGFESRPGHQVKTITYENSPGRFAVISATGQCRLRWLPSLELEGSDS